MFQIRADHIRNYIACKRKKKLYSTHKSDSHFQMIFVILVFFTIMIYQMAFIYWITTHDKDSHIIEGNSELLASVVASIVTVIFIILFEMVFFKTFFKELITFCFSFRFMRKLQFG